MTTTYANYNFGQTVLSALPEPIKDVIHEFEELYTLGLYGTDILTYINTYNSKKYKKDAAVDFYNVIGKQIDYKKDVRPYYVYVYGYICRYVIDSICQNHIWCSDELIHNVRPSNLNCDVIATFFPDIEKKEIKMALTLMNWLHETLTKPMAENYEAEEEHIEKTIKMYDSTVSQAVRLICEYQNCVMLACPLA